MALDRFGCELFAILRDAGVPLSRVATLGRQHLTVRHSELRALPPLAPLEPELDALRAAGNGYAEPFLQRLGAGDVASIDFSAYEGCTVIHDLNRPIPAEWHGRYDAVYDGGSLEHVFQFPTALANAMNLVVPGGYFITGTPSNHFNGHGFYQFGPELFYRVFDEANGFSLPLIALAEIRLGGRIFRVDDPAALKRRITFSGSGPLLLIALARRDRAAPLFQENPYQIDYEQAWADPKTKLDDGNGKRHPLRRLLPPPLLQHYDAWRAYRRQDREARIGVHEIASLAKALRRPLFN